MTESRVGSDSTADACNCNFSLRNSRTNCWPQFLEVQTLLVNPESMFWDTVIAKDSLRSDSISDGDLEHSARCRPQLVRTSPMQHLHSRHAATRCRTYENFCLHRHIHINLIVGLITCLCGESSFRPNNAELTLKALGEMVSGCPRCGYGFRCTQVTQVSKDDLVECV